MWTWCFGCGEVQARLAVESNWVAPGTIYPVRPSRPSADILHRVASPISWMSDDLFSCRVPSWPNTTEAVSSEYMQLPVDVMYPVTSIPCTVPTGTIYVTSASDHTTRPLWSSNVTSMSWKGRGSTVERYRVGRDVNGQRGKICCRKLVLRMSPNLRCLHGNRQHAGGNGVL